MTLYNTPLWQAPKISPLMRKAGTVPINSAKMPSSSFAGRFVGSLLLGFALASAPSAAQNSTVIAYDTVSRDPAISFYFPDTTDNLYLRQLRDENQLRQLSNTGSTDKEKALLLMDWTHRQWAHNGSNTPSQGDALTILKEARAGKQFRCVEYGTVLATSLLSLGYRARAVNLKTQAVETAKYGAGHVLAEVWLAAYQKWALLDAQFNIMPELNGVPLNAVELQQAMAANQAFKLIDIGGEVSKSRRRQYVSFVEPYLYFIDSSIDKRRLPVGERQLIGGKLNLMLVPLGAKNPVLFQRVSKIEHVYYTHALKDFYPPQ